MDEQTRYYTTLNSPVGDLLLAGDGTNLTLISFATGSRTRRPLDHWRRDAAPFKEAERQLNAYFAGELRAFDLAIRFNGTDFQKLVWHALLDIPFGETVTYAELARCVGKPSASRAVGAANGANPLPIVAPCHRVIGANGSLTGFGGGIATKELLLRHEGVPLKGDIPLFQAAE